jgi:regulator of replication initiation timing
MQYFKIKRGTDFDKAIKKHCELRPKWNDVYKKVSELLKENITLLVRSTQYLIIEYSELRDEENKKVFKKDGSLKANNKKAKHYLEDYKAVIQEAGLSEYEEIGHINFCYGVMRFSGEHLKSYLTSEHDVYYEADFDLAERSKGIVEPITAIEYQEKYLEELKKKENKSA